MGIFAAIEVEVRGKKAIRLTYKMNRYDNTDKAITLIVQQQLEGFERYPFSFQYLEETEQIRYPIIRVVAGPGVSVSLENFPSTPYLASQATALVDIIRAQDPEIVSPMATDISSYGYNGGEEINPPTSQVSFGFPDNYFHIERFPSEMIFHHPATGGALIVRVPQFSMTQGQTRGTRDAEARFAFEIDPEGISWVANRPLLKIVRTPSVTTEISQPIIALPGHISSLQRFNSFYKIYEVNNIRDVP